MFNKGGDSETRKGLGQIEGATGKRLLCFARNGMAENARQDGAAVSSLESRRKGHLGDRFRAFVPVPGERPPITLLVAGLMVP